MITSHTDVVGSLLRPPQLLRARENLAAGRISPAELEAAEDRAVDEAVGLQEEAGLEVVTDGEMRRLSFQSQMTEAVDGFGEVGLEVGELALPLVELVLHRQVELLLAGGLLLDDDQRLLGISERAVDTLEPVSQLLRHRQYLSSVPASFFKITLGVAGSHREEPRPNFAVGIIDALSQLDGAQTPLKALLMAKMRGGHTGRLSRGLHLQSLVPLPPGDGQGPAEGLLGAIVVAPLTPQVPPDAGQQAASLVRIRSDHFNALSIRSPISVSAPGIGYSATATARGMFPA